MKNSKTLRNLRLLPKRQRKREVNINYLLIAIAYTPKILYKINQKARLPRNLLMQVKLR